MEYETNVYKMVKKILLEMQFERESISTLSTTDEVLDDMAINNALMLVIEEINKKIEGS